MPEDDSVSYVSLPRRHDSSVDGWVSNFIDDAAQPRDLCTPGTQQISSHASGSGWEDEPVIKHASEGNSTHNGWAAVEKDQLKLSNLPTPNYPVASRERSETSVSHFVHHFGSD